MATVKPVISDISGEGSVRKIVWGPLTTTNADGSGMDWIQWADRCIQFDGTFGAGGTIKLQGSNDGTNWIDLTDPQGNAISKAAASIEAVSEITQFVRPFVSAGDGTTSLTATLLMRRAQPLRT